ncbi:MAG: hypothetical protein IH881_06985 [Myxococcales bacterium]|nr:hypothetical protein [Myxococcales bacterium]
MDLMSQIDHLRSPAVLVCIALVVLAGGVVANRQSDDLAASRQEQAQDSESLARASASRANNAYDGGVGFVVPYRPDCPPGTERQGDEPPAGFKEWCVRVGLDQGLKHGWYSEWYPDGRPARSGAYEDGLRVGVWTRWYPNGKKRVQAEFQRGLQHGKLISWDNAGNQLGEQLFRNGYPIKQRS